MALTIENGQIVSGSENLAKTDTSTASSNEVNSDTFLQLLVAEMQNQDPLEPTENTEWVSQYATFTQVEQIGEITDAVSDSKIYSLVGKTVIMVDNSSSTGYVTGQVDYVTMEDGELKLNVGGTNYSVDDIDSVVDNEYLAAVTLSATFEATMDKLPDVVDLKATDADKVTQAREAYDALTDYQKTFVAKSYVTKLEALEAQLKVLGVTTDETATDETSTGA